MKTLVICTAALLAACGGGANYRPIVDTAVYSGDYEKDQAECNQLAQGIRRSKLEMWSGALSGEQYGPTIKQQREQAVANCMRGRGYSVLR